MKDHTTVVELLLANGAEVDSKDKGIRSPLSWAAGENHETIAKLLLANGADASPKDIDGQTPLTRADTKGYNDMMRLCLKQKRHIWGKDS